MPPARRRAGLPALAGMSREGRDGCPVPAGSGRGGAVAAERQRRKPGADKGGRAGFRHRHCADLEPDVSGLADTGRVAANTPPVTVPVWLEETETCPRSIRKLAVKLTGWLPVLVKLSLQPDILEKM